MITRYFKEEKDGRLTEQEVREIVHSWSFVEDQPVLPFASVGYLVKEDNQVQYKTLKTVLMCANYEHHRTFESVDNLNKIFDYMRTHEVYGIELNLAYSENVKQENDALNFKDEKI